MFVIKVVINLQLMVMAYSSKNFKTFSSNFTINTPPKNQFFFPLQKETNAEHGKRQTKLSSCMYRGGFGAVGVGGDLPLKN